jgi:arginase
LIERHGLPDALRAAGFDVAVEEILIEEDLVPEVARSFAIVRRLAARVASALAEGAFPLLLTGNCFAAVGAVAGLGAPGPAVLWLDAHADFDVPDDNESGFFDVFALSLLTGGCWRRQCELVPGYAPVPEADVVLVGARDLEPYQWERLRGSDVTLAQLDDAPARIAALGRRRAYLHLDVDVLDPSEGRANRFAAPGGPHVADVEALVGEAGRALFVEAAALSAYDPECDADGRIGRAAVRLGVAIAGVATRRDDSDSPSAG